MRRQKPEVSDDIGNWLYCIEILSMVNVVTNTVLLYFTHKSFRYILVGEDSITAENYTPVVQIDHSGWPLDIFLLVLVVLEHILIGIKLIIRFSRSKTPEFVLLGQQERNQLINKF